MRFAYGLVPPRRTLVVFLGLMLLFGGALAWLGWQWLEQDRSLERQRVQERLEQAADSIAAELQGSLSDLESHLRYPPGPAVREPPDGVVVLRATPDAVEAHPPGGLLFHPTIPSGEGTGEGTFSRGEDLEFRRNDPDGAAELFRGLARSPKAEVRAGDWVKRSSQGFYQAGRL